MFAQYDGGSDVYSAEGISNGCGSTMNGEECFWSDMSGGNYFQCSARGKEGQTCQAAMTDNETHIAYCMGVNRSAACSCDPTTYRTSGTCTYYR